MRYSASEKREIIDLVENSSLPVRRTLDQLGIPKSTFYGWYERFREGGGEALIDAQPRSEYVAAATNIDDVRRNIGRPANAIGGQCNIDPKFGRLVWVNDNLQLVAGITIGVEHADPRYAVTTGDLRPNYLM